MQNVIYIVVLVVLQALLFNRIRIFDVAMPLVYVYYVLRMPRNMKPWLSLVLSFILGIGVDMFSNTPGLAAASLTLLAFLRPSLLEMFLRKEDPEDLRPSFGTMGFMGYFLYTLILVSIYCLTIYTLESFTLVHWYYWILNVVGSMVITTILILAAEAVRK